MVSASVSPEELRAFPLFAGLGEEALQRLSASMEELEVAAGQTLVHAGDPGSGLFVIEEGIVVVEGRGQVVIELGPGEFVGELALLVPESTRSARVRAKTDIRCLAIGAAEFRQLLEDEPRVAAVMLPIVAERLWQARAG